MKAGSRRVLIVNADDLGRTAGINSGIFESHRRGLVTSATLMVGYPGAEEAASRLDRHPDLGVGLHVALTGQAPILPTREVPSLVGSSGCFPSKPEGLGRIASDEVASEVRAQLERFRRLTGRLPTHLDSHHHSHRHPIVCDALINLARENDLPVRNCSAEVAERLRAAGVATTQSFVERFFGEQATLPILKQILAEAKEGVTEIMCHPAHVDDELRASSGYSEERAHELEALTHPEALRWVRDMELQLAHFGTACGS